MSFEEFFSLPKEEQKSIIEKIARASMEEQQHLLDEVTSH